MREHDTFLCRALIESGCISQETGDRSVRYAREHETDLTDALIALDAADGPTIARTLADVCEVPYVHLADFEPNFANAAMLPRSLAERSCLFPLFVVDGILTLAMNDPLNLDAADQVREITRCEVDPVIADRQSLRALIARAYRMRATLSDDERPAAKVRQSKTIEVAGIAAPVIAAVEQLLADAISQRASDVHINPDEHELHLRYRIDGVLHSRQGPSRSMHSAIVQRLKVMANLDLTQTRRPQDGKFRFEYEDRAVDVRLSVMPTICGENVVMRLLTDSRIAQDFRDLGISPAIASGLDDLLTTPHGMLLVTGPTGSGKTTTLYTALAKLNTPDRNVMTIEDPVEIRMPMIRQIQVHPEIGLTFAGALRSILRQDPDIVLLGEIRDEETATIALQAALTGHMVLSTLHTNDAPGAVSRLRDFGLPPFLINAALLGVIAQRLVRRICNHCTAAAEPDAFTARRLGLENAEGFRRGKGCGRCGQTGYSGRVGIYELLRFSNDIRAAVEAGASLDALRSTAESEGMRPMYLDGLDKARLGLTSLDEVVRAAAVVSPLHTITDETSLERRSA